MAALALRTQPAGMRGVLPGAQLSALSLQSPAGCLEGRQVFRAGACMLAPARRVRMGLPLSPFGTMH